MRRQIDSSGELDQRQFNQDTTTALAMLYLAMKRLALEVGVDMDNPPGRPG
jgi:hypothetical protein